MCQHRGKALVLKCHRHIREGLCQLAEKNVHIGRGLGVGSVKIEGIAHDKLGYSLPKGVFLKIIYYLCSRDSFKRRGKDTKRVALSEPYPRPAIVNSDYPVHEPQKYE